MKKMSAVEMFDELVRQGFITPVADSSQLMMPTAYRSVPNVTTAGSVPLQAPSADGKNAELERASEGDKPN